MDAGPAGGAAEAVVAPTMLQVAREIMLAPDDGELPGFLSQLRQRHAGIRDPVSGGGARAALQALLFPADVLAASQQQGQGAAAGDALDQLLQTAPSRCGKVFKPGDANFMCLDCGVDNTCVMCVDCFQHSEHVNCNYKIGTSGGGCCDCGDPEAWNAHHACTLHLKNAGANPAEAALAVLPEAVRRDGPAVFAELFEWLLRVLIVERPRSVWEAEDADAALVGEPSALKCVCLFNDETHTFRAVIAQVQKATGCSAAEAEKRAHEVDHYGRTVVFWGSSAECNTARHCLLEIELDAQILDSKFVALQELALDTLRWVLDLCQRSDGIRMLVCAAMLVPVAVATGGDDESVGEGDDELAGLESSATIDHFFISFAQLWKEVQDLIKQVIFGVMLVEPDYKPLLAASFVRHYSHMHDCRSNDQAGSDGITTLSVQLFTVPTVSRVLVKEHDALGTILSFLISKLEHAQDPISGLLDCEAPTGILTTEADEYPMILTDIQYILGCGVGSLLPSLPKFLELISVVQGMDPVRRKIGTHVELESQSWTRSVTLTFYLVRTLLSKFVEGCSESTDDLRAAVKLTLKAINRSTQSIPCKDTLPRCRFGFRFVDFRVHKDPVSIHIPLHRFLAALFIKAGEVGLSLSTAINFDSWPSHDQTGFVISLAEHPLRVLALNAQVASQLWVRNGYSLLNALFNYRRRETIGLETYDKDIAMIQAAATMLAPEQLIVLLCKKFELATWVDEEFETMQFNDGQSKVAGVRSDVRELCTKLDGAGALQGEVELNYFQAVLSCFMDLLYQVSYERGTVGIGQVTSRDVLRREVIHQLSIGGMPHSTLTKKINKQTINAGSLASVLEEVADFHQPSASFKLKDDVRSEFNPCFYHFTAKEKEAAEASMEKWAASRPSAQRRSSESDRGSTEQPAQQSQSDALCYLLPPPPFAPTAPFVALQALPASGLVLFLLHTVMRRAGGGWDESSGWKFRDGINFAVNDRLALQALRYIATGLQEPEGTDFPGAAQRFAVALTGYTAAGLSMLAALSRVTEVGDAKLAPLYKWILHRLYDGFPSEPTVKAAVIVISMVTGHHAGSKEDFGVGAASDAVRGKRKAASAVRQAKIMKTFGKRQAAFLENWDREEALRKQAKRAERVARTVPSGAAATSLGPASTDAIAGGFPQDGPGLAASSAGGPAVTTEATAEDTVAACVHCHESTGQLRMLALAQRSCVFFAAGGEIGDEPHTVELSSCGHRMCVGCLEQFKRTRSAAIRHSHRQHRHPERFRIDATNGSVELIDFFCPLCNVLCNCDIPVVSGRVEADSMSGALTEVPMNFEVSVEGFTALCEASDAILAGACAVDGAKRKERSHHDASDAVQARRNLPHAIPSKDMIAEVAKINAIVANALRVPAPAEFGPAVSGKAGHDLFFDFVTTTLLSFEQGGGSAAHSFGTSALMKTFRPFVRSYCAMNRSTLRPILEANLRLLLPSKVARPASEPPTSALTQEPFRLFVETVLMMDDIGFNDASTRRAIMQTCALLAELQSTVGPDPVTATHECNCEESKAAIARMQQCVVATGRLRSPHLERLPPCDPQEFISGVVRTLRLMVTFNRIMWVDADAAVDAEVMDLEAKLRLTIPKLVRELNILVPNTQCPPPLADDAADPVDSFDPASYVHRSAPLHACLQHWLASTTPVSRTLPPIARIAQVRTLVDLPTEFRMLMFQALEYVCCTTRLKSGKPALCLTCGEYVCAQSTCCQTDVGGVTYGGCTKHAMKCGAGRGMFLLIKNCSVILLDHDRGAIQAAPYVDEHGEQDPGLTRGRPLFLSRQLLSQLQRIHAQNRISLEVAAVSQRGHLVERNWWQTL